MLGCRCCCLMLRNLLLVLSMVQHRQLFMQLSRLLRCMLVLMHGH